MCFLFRDSYRYLFAYVATVLLYEAHGVVHRMSITFLLNIFFGVMHRAP